MESLRKWGKIIRMKKLILLLLVSFLTSSIYGQVIKNGQETEVAKDSITAEKTVDEENLQVTQGLTIGQLLNLSKKGLGEVEEYLTLNHWHFFRAVDETEDTYGNAKFVFDRPNFGKGDLGEYFLTYYYSVDDSANAIEISFRKKEVYANFNEQIKNLKFKLKSSKTIKGNIIKVFKHGPNIIELTIPPNFEGANSYKYLFSKNSSYKKFRK